MSTESKVFRLIESYRNEMIDMQVKLCSLPAISPQSGGEGEAKKAEYLHEFLKDIGIKNIQIISAPDLDAAAGFRPNLLARYPGRDSSKTVWVMTHIDIVPPGELALWSGNPYKAWIEGGKIYGLGVEDNQQDMIASLFALKALLSLGITPRNDIGIALVSDEEIGSERGIGYVLKTDHPFREQDLIIVPDAGNEDGSMIEVAEKNILWLTFKTIGKQAHGSTPEKGINSLRAASQFIVELAELYKIFNARDTLFDPPISTFEPTKKEPNVQNINTIPGEDIFSMDCRILPKYSIEEVEDKITEIARNVERTYNVEIFMEEEQRTPAAPATPTDAPLVRALQEAVQVVYGVDAKPIGIGGGTVAGFFRDANFNAACWSRSDETAHQPNEYCIIDNMIGDAKVFAHIFLQE